MLARRGFLKALGIAPVAAPAAAKEVLAKHGLSAAPSVASLNGAYLAAAEAPDTSDIKSRLFKEIGEGRLSDYEILEAENDAAGHPAAGFIDADIAALKSTSAVHKAAQQRERNFTRAAERRWREKVSHWIRWES